jgi:2,3-bisphosphoglycerate-dependent phosphoglycerate mutase
MHLLVIRHGECLGQCDPSYYRDPDSPLSQRGRQQAQHVAERLRGERVTHILSSPLVRSLETASIIAETSGTATIDVWVELREGWSDPHRGFVRAELQRRFPRALLPHNITDQGWYHGGDNTYGVFFARAEHVLHEIKQQFGPDDHVVIVTHGGFANYLLHLILHIPPTMPQWFELANCAISEIRLVIEPEKERPNWPLYPPVQAEILRINDVAHIPKEA